jgi:ribosomal-protein-alanine N-acetyltransferase
MANQLSVREITRGDVEPLADYWTKSDPEFLVSMGVDLSKLPGRDDLVEMLSQQLGQDYAEKKSYAIIWLIDGNPAGHSNINKIIFGNEAYMHLHLWNSDTRKKGMGLELIKMTLPYYFKNFQLRNLYCEPYALNPAPNSALKSAGFDFVKKYRTVPGYLNFEQEVMRWEMTSGKFLQLFSV